MSEILNKYKRWKPILLLNEDKYNDFVLSLDNSNTININGELTNKCLISYIDINNNQCVGDNGEIYSLPQFKYRAAINEDVQLKDFGYTNVDNGLIRYDKENTTLDEFVDLISNTELEITSGDTRLYFYPVNGNSKHYNYECSIQEDSGTTYYSFNGGFLQGFYKLFNFDYTILPKDIEKTWNLEFVLRPRTDYQESGNTLNIEHPNNKGIFFYMGVRSENKFARFYGEDLNKYKNRDSYTGHTCFEECIKGEDLNKENNKKNKFPFFYDNDFCKCNFYEKNKYNKELVYEEEPSGQTSGSTICKYNLITSEGHNLDNNDFYEVLTDNKFIILDRTKDGYTSDNWDDENLFSLIINKKNIKKNLYLLLDRTKDGYTVDTLKDYKEEDNSNYNVVHDLTNNAFALKINEDFSIGYRYLIKDCDSENGYSIREERSFPNIIEPNEWNVINAMFKIIDGDTDKCGYSLGNRKMRIYIYVNGYLKLVSKELPEFNFRELNEYFDKQECVPYNISLGGGTQGLAESMWIDNYKNPYCKVLPLEEYFGGSFIGDIRSFKFYDCQMQFNEIKNNFIFEKENKKIH